MIVKGGKFLTFNLGKEEYGIPIGSVREINGMMPITEVPKAPHAVRGVVNLRGKIIPVLDLRLRFGLPGQEYTERTCMVVVEGVAEGSKTRQWSFVVDSVSEVIMINEAEIAPPPQYEEGLTDTFLVGMGKVKGKVVLLLDVAKVLGQYDSHFVQQAI